MAFSFGATVAPAPAGGGGGFSFGGTPAPAASTSLFGAPTPAPSSTSGGLFGSTTTGGGGLFGSTPATPAPAAAGGAYSAEHQPHLLGSLVRRQLLPLPRLGDCLVRLLQRLLLVVYLELRLQHRVDCLDRLLRPQHLEVSLVHHNQHPQCSNINNINHRYLGTHPILNCPIMQNEPLMEFINS